MSIRKSLTVLAAAAALCTVPATVTAATAAAHTSVKHTALADTPWGSAPGGTTTTTGGTAVQPADDTPWG